MSAGHWADADQPMPPDAYATLGISARAAASPADIKRAYTALCLAFHPDKIGADASVAVAQETFQLIHEAYEMLSDPLRRQIYDDHGAAALFQWP
jgi:DnaJ-class molecular chaperone